MRSSARVEGSRQASRSRAVRLVFVGCWVLFETRTALDLGRRGSRLLFFPTLLDEVLYHEPLTRHHVQKDKIKGKILNSYSRTRATYRKIQTSNNRAKNHLSHKSEMFDPKPNGHSHAYKKILKRPIKYTDQRAIFIFLGRH